VEEEDRSEERVVKRELLEVLSEDKGASKANNAGFCDEYCNR
jgi:hypothetical protein